MKLQLLVQEQEATSFALLSNHNITTHNNHFQQEKKLALRIMRVRETVFSRKLQLIIQLTIKIKFLHLNNFWDKFQKVESSTSC